MKTFQKLIAIAMVLAIMVACSFASAQDTLNVFKYSKEDATLYVHTDSTQEVVRPYGECYIYTDTDKPFYITLGDTDNDKYLYSSGSMFRKHGDYYAVKADSSNQVRISYGGETFIINVRNNSEKQ